MGIRERMLVRDVMSSPVITVNEDETVEKVAQLMDKYRLGCIIVTSKDGKPIGIITERDLVVRVLAKNLVASELKAKDVMSSPLMTISPDATISEAARMMSRLNIRRLGVVYRGELLGIVSSKDVLAVTPELIEIIQEKARIESQGSSEEIEPVPLTGCCDRCGAWSDDLREIEGQFLCEDCRLELKGEK
ncbi:inosine-5-monophosphate dehydrogenase [Candidatus Bathyarchaeota archaeon]|nr:MAG: inosine-5-monophosphate dehydrogenase [Candidatus Bathyarchaeota archaeon]